MATKQKKWGPEDDAKLAKLFRDRAVDPEKLSAKDIHLVHDRHFPERKNFSSFSALYRKKARAWSLHETLSGGRKNASTDDDDSDDDDEEEEIEESFEDTATSDMPPKKEKKPSATSDADSKLASGMKGMSLGGTAFKRWSMNFAFPFMIKEFVHNGRKSCTVELLVPTMDESRVRPVVSKDLEHLYVTAVIPDFFPEYNRIEAANFGDARFHGNTNIATAHHNVVQEIRTAFADKTEVTGEPMKIKLPFKVEESIAHWELQLFHGDAEVSAASGDQQYFSLLKVDLISIERVFVKPAGGMRVVGSPNAADHRAAAAAAAAP